MADRTPQTGEYVTFPIDQDNEVDLEWWQKDGKSKIATFKQAKYYVDKCYFGPAASSGDKKKSARFGVKVRGETIVFVAKELIDERTSGGPHLKKYHIRDRMEEEYEAAPKQWVFLPLDSFFHYGQDAEKNPKLRWLVYHPGLGARNMFQHRFGQNTITKIADAGVEWSASIPDNWGGSIVPKVLGVLLKALSANVGHKLHQFPGNEVSESNSTSEADEKLQIIEVKELIEWTAKKDSEGGGGGSPVPADILTRYTSRAEVEEKKRAVPKGVDDLRRGHSKPMPQGDGIETPQASTTGQGTASFSGKSGRTLTKGGHLHLPMNEQLPRAKANQVMPMSTPGTS